MYQASAVHAHDDGQGTKNHGCEAQVVGRRFQDISLAEPLPPFSLPRSLTLC